MDYGDFKDLTRRAASDKFWHDKAFNIAKNPKFDEDQRGLASNTRIFFYYVLLIFSGNMHGLFLLKIEKVLQLLFFKNF